ncbi:uncharacterized protein METZ01_LOCUS238271, partial [marine metagenome]
AVGNNNIPMIDEVMIKLKILFDFTVLSL